MAHSTAVAIAPSAIPSSLAACYRQCRTKVRQHFGDWAWAVSNLPEDRQQHLAAILAYAVQLNRQLDIHIPTAVRRAHWMQTRDQLRDALRDDPETCQSEWAALVHTINEFSIPRQYFFDMLSGAEMAIRIPRFQAFDQWQQFSCRIGGSVMLCAMPILGLSRGGYESSAIACGQAIQLTWLLGNNGTETQKITTFFPALDAQVCRVDLSRLDPDNPPAEFSSLVLLEVGRIEKLFREGGHVLDYLTFDGQRVMTSIITAFWTLLNHMRQNPTSILRHCNRFSLTETWRLRMAHLLGLEGGAPVLPPKSHQGH